MSIVTAVGRSVVALIAASMLCAQPMAQTWPDKPIKLIVNFPPGGVADTLARAIAPGVSEMLKQPVVVENKPGANGSIGADAVAKSPPDGYTFLVGAVHHTIAVSVYASLPYSLEKDLMPVTLMAIVPNVVVLHPKWAQITSIKELVEYSKANPDKLNYASAGNGTSHHLAPELFKTMTGAKLNHVPYKGAGPATQDLIAGQVDLMFDGMGSSAPQIRGGKLKPLAVTTTTRSPAFPELPTMQEAGVPGFVVSSGFSWVGPANMPKPIVEKLNGALVKAVNDPVIRKQLLDRGADPIGNSPEQHAALIKTEIEKWQRVAKQAGISPE